MTTAFIQEHIERKMAEMGFPSFQTRMRTIVLPGNAQLEIRSFNMWTYFPLEYIQYQYITVESNFGYLAPRGINGTEMTFEHTGLITLANTRNWPVQITFIQAYPTGQSSNSNESLIIAS